MKDALGHDMSVEVTAKYRPDGGIDILSVREHPQAGQYDTAPPATSSACPE